MESATNSYPPRCGIDSRNKPIKRAASADSKDGFGQNCLRKTPSVPEVLKESFPFYNPNKLHEANLHQYANYFGANPILAHLYPNRWFTLSQLLLSKQLLHAFNTGPTYIHKQCEKRGAMMPPTRTIPLDFNYNYPITCPLYQEQIKRSNIFNGFESATKAGESSPILGEKMILSEPQTENNLGQKCQLKTSARTRQKVDFESLISKTESELIQCMPNSCENNFNPCRLDIAGALDHLAAESTTRYKRSDGKDRKAHQCLYCGKLYSRKYGLKIHIRTHTGYKPLKCKVCGRPFGDPSNLNKHVRLHAEGETPYRCEFCGKVLVRRRDLERHIKSRHPGEKNGIVEKMSVIACPPADPRLWRPAI